MAVKQQAERLAITSQTSPPQRLVAVHHGGHDFAISSELHSA
ncbi:MAG: hypothetical protein ACRDK8_12230 [Solirubrobacteraceae bacterium]